RATLTQDSGESSNRQDSRFWSVQSRFKSGLPSSWSGSPLEDHPEVVEELALEADAVGAHSGREGQPEVGAGQPAWHQPELHELLPQAGLGESPPPLPDRLDVVEAAAG